jgi:hypothetical protein
MRSVITEAMSAAQACAADITSRPRYADLGTKTHFGRGDIPAHKLADPRLLTLADSRALLLLFGEVQECRLILLDGAIRMHPAVVVIFIDWFAGSDRIYAEAISGRLTWGQFNQSLKEILLRTQARLQQADALIQANMQNTQFEIEQRHRAVAAFDQWLNQQNALGARGRTIAPAGGGLRSITCKYVETRLECGSS